MVVVHGGREWGAGPRNGAALLAAEVRPVGILWETSLQVVTEVVGRVVSHRPTASSDPQPTLAGHVVAVGVLPVEVLAVQWSP